MRIKKEGNKLYRVFRAIPGNYFLWVVASDNAHARKLVNQYIKDNSLPKLESFSVSWYIYDNNGGITSLPLGTIVKAFLE
jgi:hypothetical protein